MLFRSPYAKNRARRSVFSSVGLCRRFSHQNCVRNKIACAKGGTRAQSRKQEIQGGALAIFLKVKAKVIFIIPVLCLQKRSPENKKYRAERPPFFVFVFGVETSICTLPKCRPTSAVPKTRNTGRSARHFFFTFLESKRVSVLCQNIDQDLVDLWSLLGHFGGVFESFWSFLIIFGGPRPRCSKFGGLERN